MDGLRIRNWEKFQHFKDRTPPWIKLYRDILDDPDWHDLDGESAKVLTMLWLIASEDETHQGMLPGVRKLAFRLRISEQKLKQSLIKLSHWLIQDDITPISGGYQSDAPETETETETETDIEAPNGASAPRRNRREAAASKNSIGFDYENGQWDGIRENDAQDWSSAYPALDIDTELFRAAEWVKANPANRKSNWRRFLTNWFSRAQDRAPRRAA